MANKYSISHTEDNEQDSFKATFCLLYPKLMALATRYVGENVAEDMVQDVFTQYWENKDVWELDKVHSFLYKMIQNKCINHLMHQKVASNYEALITIAQARKEYLNQWVDHHELIEKLHTKQLLEKVEAELEKLSPRVAEAFRLRYYQDLKNKEVAETMGISLRTAETHIQLAVSQLRKNICKEHLLILTLLFNFC